MPPSHPPRAENDCGSCHLAVASLSRFLIE
ncbi:MAG: hypothetical protein K8F91_18935 [Candidatus Obscuribacterales bacterium]|nr:hypothetical protein [Candidatus Obscuribacterales bacterium]